MTSLKILGLDGKEKGNISMPAQFDEFIRADLIQRAVLAIQSENRTPYGTDQRAGKRPSARMSKRRRRYRGSYGKGMARVPRKILSRNGTQMSLVGAFVSGTVGGLRAHPPKAARNWVQKINNKERNKAIRSALAASINKEIVTTRGHETPKNYPFIISDDFEKIKKTKEVETTFEKLGLTDELGRASIKKIRAGTGKARGRKYKKRKGPLLVVSKKCELLTSAKNIAGIDAVSVKELNAELLAPGAMPGRLTLYTESAIKTIKEEHLYD